MHGDVGVLKRLSMRRERRRGARGGVIEFQLIVQKTLIFQRPEIHAGRGASGASRIILGM